MSRRNRLLRTALLAATLLYLSPSRADGTADADGLHRPWDLPASRARHASRLAAAPPSSLPASTGFSPADGWPTASGDESSEVGPVENGYLVGIQQTATPEHGAMAAFSNLQPLGDFELMVDARLEQAGSAGYAIHLRRRSDEERFTLIVDSERQAASFYRRLDGVTTVLWDWSPLPSLRPATEDNRLTIRAAGQHFTASVNGTPVFDLEAAGPTSGTLWLAVVTWDQPARAIFENYQLSVLD